jgi:zinc protease
MSGILTFRRLPASVLIFFLILAASIVAATPQAPPDPVREQLLNGLPVLLWTRPGSPDLTIKLRIHSGAAFDLSGKAGEMTLLGDMLFPDPATLEFFTDEMNGKLDVDTDLDAITITMQGKAAEFDRIIEILRNALITTQLTRDIVARQRDRRIKIVRDTSISPSLVADRAIAQRLFGDYPYGRPTTGSPESLARIERPDLMLARDRFLNPNNATLTIVGGIEKNRAMRALRQLLGAWRKSEQVIPTTFRAPQPADSKTLIINGPADQTAEVRLAVRGLARSDADYNAANLLALVAQKRWLSAELSGKPFFVRHEAHVLPGIFLMGASVDSKATAGVIASAKKVIESLIKVPATAAEMEQARNELIVQINNRLAKPETMVDSWLDGDTFKLPPLNEQLQSLRSVTPADLQRLATRLFQQAPIASVVLGNAQQLRAELEGRVDAEVMGEIAKPPAQEVKPAPKPNTETRP